MEPLQGIMNSIIPKLGLKKNNGNYKILINNIKDNTTKKREGTLGENHKTSNLYAIKLKNEDEIKIGVIGLSFNKYMG